MSHYDAKVSRRVLRGACGLVTILWAGNGPRLPGLECGQVRIVQLATREAQHTCYSEDRILKRGADHGTTEAHS